jgi:hypothetical protein
MSKTDLTEKFWQEFRAANSDVNADEPYQVWYFGSTSEMAKELAGKRRQLRSFGNMKISPKKSQ